MNLTKSHWMYLALILAVATGYLGYKEYERKQAEA